MFLIELLFIHHAVRQIHNRLIYSSSFSLHSSVAGASYTATGAGVGVVQSGEQSGKQSGKQPGEQSGEQSDKFQPGVQQSGEQCGRQI